MRKLAIFATLGAVILLALFTIKSTLATGKASVPSLSSSMPSIEEMTRRATNLPTQDIVDPM
jgi:hypothetical protein